MSEEELRKIAKEEMAKSIMDNLDSALIFTYIKNLEEENKQLKFDCKQTEALKHFFMNEKDKLEKENEGLELQLDKSVDEQLEREKYTHELEKKIEKYAKQIDLEYVEENFIDIEAIKKLLGYEKEEEVAIDTIISLLKTIIEECDRLEDIEDWCATQCISKNKIREKIKELENIRETLTDSNGMLEISASIDALKEVLGEEKDD